MKYKFKAKDWNGKNVTGELDMENKSEVLESIRSNGLIPLSVEVKANNMFTLGFGKMFHRIGLKQITTFTRELSTMMTAGLPLTDALSMLKNQSEESPMMFEVLDGALNSVRGGQPLGKSLEKYKNVFGEAYVASVSAGEEGGVLEEVLQKLSVNLENQNEFTGKVKGAMIYPAIVVIGMVIVSTVMMIFVIPKLTSLYADMGTSKLPPITRGLMAVSDFMQKWWFLMPGVIVGLMVLFKSGTLNPEIKLKLDTFKLRVPIWGELMKKTILADSIRTMSMMLAAGISLVDSLRIVSSVANNELYRRAYVKIAERVQKGFSISSSFEETGIFPVIVNQMVSTGEATGKLDEVLLKVANYFSSEAEQSVKALTSAIEPVIMIVLGIGVAFLVVAVIMPIYNLTSQF
ncbi:type II secretion system F family protein [Candidatus Shapirobacteria bacterium]|nr:type II secretion system F family protein [Candidatus Shapirobacteria bacterium]